MAIKRPIKNRGTPSRKPVTSAAVHHIDVRAQPHMVSGTSYQGWLCKNKSCGRVIAIAPTPAGSKPALPEFDDHMTAITCPHCGDEDLYRWSARGEHPYTPVAPL